ncbi:PilZ domain-containing protein [Rhodanobacter sp. AS-Z3]|uniref:PilZ domain-containing protein n=1 Tax=Rhodanobacter sp. AS-Z3 TaxID=3031330 RepID=UPI00247A03F0|nr:PilZ domain-containing protein [Rhodanobacter sp. AS-Z3]WEN14614.1 PilZ domain-containing protein [Rhodanobacter sp. AS-Z3]
MSTVNWNEFEQLVSVEELLHVAVTPLVWPVPEAQAVALVERNGNTLAAIAALEERRVEPADDDNPLLQEIRRMDAKLTALVDVVNRLLTPTDKLPVQRLIRFNARGAVIPSEMVPASAEALLLSLRFDNCPSLPLELPAKAERQVDDGRTFVCFLMPNDALGDAIERLVFRHHRRKVAGARQLPA